MSHFREKTLKGLTWNIVAQIAKQVLSFVVSVILARLLIPKDFGLVAMILVFTGFAGLFRELGFGAALIQKQEIEDRHLSSVFWLSIIVGLLLSIIVVAIAPLITAFYHEPRLKSLTMLISTTFFISSFNTVQSAILRRSMDFRKLAIIEITSIIVASSVAVTLALIGFGVWSLAWQLVISSTVGVFIMWQVSSWRPQRCFDKSAVKELLGFSANLLGFNVFNYWVRNADDLLIGRCIGSIGLGIYTRAYGLMLMPLNQISGTVGQVMLPSLSRIQEDKQRVKQIYLRAISVIALITFPMMLGLFAIADSFILALLGPKWKDVIPLLQVFSMLGMVQSIQTTVGWIYNSQGRTDWQLRWGIVAGSLLILSIIIGILIGGILSVAVCYAIMSGGILVYHNFEIPGKLINMNFRDIIRSVAGQFGCGLFMSGAIYILGMILPLDWPHWLNLLVRIPTGIIVYVLLIHSFKLKAYVEFKALIREQWNHKLWQLKKQEKCLENETSNPSAKVVM